MIEQLKNHYDTLNVDQKKYAVISVFVFLLLIVYGVSKTSDGSENIVVEPKKESFKNGDIVSNNASSYYKSKGKHLTRQYEDVKSSQKILEDQLKEIKLALEKSLLKKTETEEERSLSRNQNLALNDESETLGKK